MMARDLTLSNTLHLTLFQKGTPMQNAVHVRSLNLLFVWIAVLLTLTLMVTGYGLDTLVPMAHDSFHDARHAAGFACH